MLLPADSLGPASGRQAGIALKVAQPRMAQDSSTPVVESPPGQSEILSHAVDLVSVPRTLGGRMLRFLRHQTRRWLLVLGVCEFLLLTLAFWLAAHIRAKGAWDQLDDLSVHLLPRGFAIPATAGNLARVAELKRLAEEQAKEEIAKAKELELKIGALSVQIERASGEEDRMWGSVTAKDIEEAFSNVGMKIERRRIQLPDPIKTFGPQEVPIRIHASVMGALKIDVVKKKK